MRLLVLGRSSSSRHHHLHLHPADSAESEELTNHPIRSRSSSSRRGLRHLRSSGMSCRQIVFSSSSSSMSLTGPSLLRSSLLRSALRVVVARCRLLCGSLFSGRRLRRSLLCRCLFFSSCIGSLFGFLCSGSLSRSGLGCRRLGRSLLRSRPRRGRLSHRSLLCRSLLGGGLRFVSLSSVRFLASVLLARGLSRRALGSRLLSRRRLRC